MIRNQTNELTIRPKMSSSAIMFIVVGVLLGFFLVAYFSYAAGVKSGYGELGSEKILMSELSNNVEELRAELAQTQENLTFAQRQQQIQEEAYKQLSKAYSNSEQKNSVLGSRLDFYQSIISPEDGQSGPVIQSLEHKYSEGKVSFDITLVQAIKHKNQVRGSMRVKLIDGDNVVGQWPLSSVRSVGYKYFQQVSGSIESETLSDDAKIKVEMALQGGEKLERWFVLAKGVVNP